MKLIINKPRIEKNRLISKIEYSKNKEYDLFFEVDDEYSRYLSTDNANAFFIALLPFIVKFNYDVEIKSPISSQLYYQLTSYLLPMLCKEFKKKDIQIKCELTDKKYNGKGVGASVSCGVDSFYTLLKHKKCIDKSYDISHLCFFNAGSNGEYGGKQAKKLYDERVEHIRQFCKENGYPLVTVNSNMNELIMMNHEKRHTFTTLACVFCLEKLFSKYYFASGFGFNGSHITDEDTAYYDILNVHCLSNENISFYCSGIETTRMEKVKFISEFEETYNWLNVCVGDSWTNCCKCTKCIRTMTALDSIDKLNLYENVFNISYFKNNRNRILAELLIGNRDEMQHDFCDEILMTYKKNNKKIPVRAYLISLFPNKSNIKIFLKKFLPRKIISFIKNKRKKINDGWMD